MARKYLKKYQIRSPPVSVAKIISAEKIIVETTLYSDETIGNRGGEKEQGTSLTIDVWDATGFVLHSRLSPVTLRCAATICATSICQPHKVLRDSEEIVWEPSDPLEVEVNQFAAELLMTLFKKE